ncbi:hypothetical protein Tco_0613600 [Tanacetum coccineum]
MIFNPNEEDDIWLNQQYWELLRWKLHEYSGVHSLFLDGTSIQINMLVEKKYPLKKEILEKMINLKIEAEEDSDMAIELIMGGLLGIKELLQDNAAEELSTWMYEVMYGEQAIKLIMCGDIVKDSNSYLKSRGIIEDFVSFREMITSQLQGKLWLNDEVPTRLCLFCHHQIGEDCWDS